MGDIIKFDFVGNKRIPETGKEEKTEKRTSHGVEIPERLMPFIKFIDFVISDKYDKLTNLEVTKEAFLISAEIVKNYTNEELIGWLENSSESDWRSKPSFYKAVYEELKIRMPRRP